MKKLAAFSTVEEFFGVYSRMKRPQDLPILTDYFLFKEGLRPTWEGMSWLGDLYIKA
jgi:translation initiation factor 4E